MIVVASDIRRAADGDVRLESLCRPNRHHISEKMIDTERKLHCVDRAAAKLSTKKHKGK